MKREPEIEELALGMTAWEMAAFAAIEAVEIERLAMEALGTDEQRERLQAYEDELAKLVTPDRLRDLRRLKEFADKGEVPAMSGARRFSRKRISVMVARSTLRMQTGKEPSLTDIVNRIREAGVKITRGEAHEIAAQLDLLDRLTDGRIKGKW